jgi:hypothetical protein
MPVAFVAAEPGKQIPGIEILRINIGLVDQPRHDDFHCAPLLAGSHGGAIVSEEGGTAHALSNYRIGFTQELR